MKVSAEQAAVLACLEEAGAMVYVWRPSQFDEIVEALSW